MLVKIKYHGDVNTYGSRGVDLVTTTPGTSAGLAAADVVPLDAVDFISEIADSGSSMLSEPIEGVEGRDPIEGVALMPDALSETEGACCDSDCCC